ncbi:MAG: hypothetical protein DRJ69_06295 [Thermoprotei archaeon]|nr:MAG: hypothetical protein DRJ69_06295 [Thermoprotei archaeon]
MKSLDIAWYAFKGLRSRKTRSALTILGISIGIVAVIVLTSNTSGFDNFLKDVLSRIGSNNVWIVPVKQSVKFTDTDVMMLKRLPDVKAVAPFYLRRVIVKAGSIEKRVNFIATDPRVLKLILPDLKLKEGTPLQPVDLSVVALGYKVANPPEEPSSRINLYSSILMILHKSSGIEIRSFMVGAIYDEFGSTPYLDVDNSVLGTVGEARTIFGLNYYPSIVIVVKSPEAVDPLIHTLRDMYGEDVEIISPLTIVRNVRMILSNFSILMLIVAGMSLLVAGIGIMNTMMISVMERTREIGILRAMGFSRRDVALIFLAEAALIGVIGGIIGILLGVTASITVGDIFGRMFQIGEASTQVAQALQISYTPVISPELLLESFLFATFVGIFSGLYPALKASRMDPIQALRAE